MGTNVTFILDILKVLLFIMLALTVDYGVAMQ